MHALFFLLIMISWADDRGSCVAFDVSSASHVSLSRWIGAVGNTRALDTPFCIDVFSISRIYVCIHIYISRPFKAKVVVSSFYKSYNKYLERRLGVGAYVSSGGHNIGQTLPTEWSNYLLIGGSPVSRTITLANPLDGNFNRYNWNRKTGRNADCPSSAWLSVEP